MSEWGCAEPRTQEPNQMTRTSGPRRRRASADTVFSSWWARASWRSGREGWGWRFIASYKRPRCAPQGRQGVADLRHGGWVSWFRAALMRCTLAYSHRDDALDNHRAVPGHTKRRARSSTFNASSMPRSASSHVYCVIGNRSQSPRQVSGPVSEPRSRPRSLLPGWSCSGAEDDPSGADRDQGRSCGAGVRGGSRPTRGGCQ